MFSEYYKNLQEFSQVPFWFWNDVLNKDEIVRQLDDFQAHGIHAFVIHPRAGLPENLSWMSDNLLSFMRFTIIEAQKRNMWIVLYDEGMYPSGSSAGQVVEENPDYACRGLIMIDLNEVLPNTVVKGVHIDENGTCKMSSHQTLLAQLTRKCDGHKIAIIDLKVNSVIRGLHYCEGDPSRRDDHLEVSENTPAASNLLNPSAIECFIQKVYQTFYDNFSEYFGSTIKAIFTDEPNLLGRRGWEKGFDPRPGTTDILLHVNRILGYDFTPFLISLWDESEPEALTHRENYYRAVNIRLEETYYQPISTWCKNHNIQLTGHPAESDEMGILDHFHIPGQDIVARYIEPGKISSIEGKHSTMAKCASSAMIHMGRQRNSNEFAGAYGHHLTYREYRWLALWLLIRGCNLLYPHAFYYSVRGPRIDERPRDVGPNSPWWNIYPSFADLTGKICWLNTDSQHVCKIAMLGTTDYLPWSAAKMCFQNQLDFNYLTTKNLFGDSKISNHRIQIKSMNYSVLIVEKSVQDRLTEEMMHAIKELEQKIPIIWTHNATSESNFVAEIEALIPSEFTFFPRHPDLRIRCVIKNNKFYLLLFNEGEQNLSFRISSNHAELSSEGILFNMELNTQISWRSNDVLELSAHSFSLLELCFLA